MANYKIKNDLILGNKVESNTSRAGTNCYYWDAIDFENMRIHICDGWQPGTHNYPFPIITNDFDEAGVIIGTGPSGLSPEELVGQEFSITNGEHYYRFGRVTNCDYEVIEFEFVNGHVFDSIVTYDNPDNIHGLSYSLVFNDLPELGDHTVGISARAYGEETKSYASNSTAMGKYTEAYGNGSIASGKLTKAIGNYSASFGFDTEAQGHHSISSGKLTKAIGNSSFASGSDTIARGNYSFTSGYGTEAQETAFASGYYSKALSPYSFVSGFKTTVELDEESSVGSRGASAIGAETIAKGYAAHAQGISTQALAQGSFAAGRESIAEGKYSTAIGDGSKTSADAVNSFAFGKGCTADGNNAIAGGNGSKAGRDAVAIGHNCTSADHGIAFGYNTNVASHSYGLGRNCKTTCNYQVAIGVNNNVSDDMLFMIGNGADWDSQEGGTLPITSRQNAFTVYKTGETKTGLLTLSKDSTSSNKLGKNDITTITALRETVERDEHNLKIGMRGIDGNGNIETNSYINITPNDVLLHAEPYDGSPATTLHVDQFSCEIAVGGEDGTRLNLDAGGLIIYNGNLTIGTVTITSKQLADLLKILKNNPGLVEGTNITATDDAVTLA